jgi:hypothetical protein
MAYSADSRDLGKEQKIKMWNGNANPMQDKELRCRFAAFSHIGPEAFLEHKIKFAGLPRLARIQFTWFRWAMHLVQSYKMGFWNIENWYNVVCIRLSK